MSEQELENQQSQEENQQNQEMQEEEQQSIEQPQMPSAMADPLVRQALADLGEENRKLRESIEGVKKSQEPPYDPKQFYDDPRRHIREEVAAQVAPLVEFVQGFKAESNYTKAKNKLKMAPQFANMLAVVEDLVDNQFENVPAGTPVNEQTIAAAITHAYGAIAAGLVPGRTLNKAPEPVQKTPAPIRPASLPPSAPKPPVANPVANKYPPLTESMRGVLKRMNMTPAQYYASQDPRFANKELDIDQLREMDALAKEIEKELSNV